MRCPANRKPGGDSTRQREFAVSEFGRRSPILERKCLVLGHFDHHPDRILGRFVWVWLVHEVVRPVAEALASVEARCLRGTYRCVELHGTIVAGRRSTSKPCNESIADSRYQRISTIVSSLFKGTNLWMSIVFETAGDV
jgi:hypothetical protein